MPGSTELWKPTTIRCRPPRKRKPGRSTNSLALLQDRPAGNVHVKEVDFLVSLGDVAVFVDPQDRVLDLVGIQAGFMDTDMNGQFLTAGCLAQAQHELALVNGLDEADGLRGGAGDVVACFREEEGLRWGSAAWTEHGTSAMCGVIAGVHSPLHRPGQLS